MLHSKINFKLELRHINLKQGVTNGNRMLRYLLDIKTEKFNIDKLFNYK